MKKMTKNETVLYLDISFHRVNFRIFLIFLLVEKVRFMIESKNIDLANISISINYLRFS